MSENLIPHISLFVTGFQIIQQKRVKKEVNTLLPFFHMILHFLPPGKQLTQSQRHLSPEVLH